LSALSSIMCEHPPEAEAILLLRDYRITIPSKLQKQLGVKPGDYLFCTLRKATEFQLWRARQEQAFFKLKQAVSHTATAVKDGSGTGIVVENGEKKKKEVLEHERKPIVFPDAHYSYTP